MSFAPRHVAAVALFVSALLPPPPSAFAAPAFAGTIRGRVTDAETGQPIVAAQIVVVGATQRYGAISDNNGNYVIRGAPTGRATLRATRIGFQPLEQAVAVPAD